MRTPVNDNMAPLGPGTLIYGLYRIEGGFVLTKTQIAADAVASRFALAMQPHPLCDHMRSKPEPPPRSHLHIV